MFALCGVIPSDSALFRGLPLGRFSVIVVIIEVICTNVVKVTIGSHTMDYIPLIIIRESMGKNTYWWLQVAGARPTQRLVSLGNYGMEDHTVELYAAES